MNGGDKIKNYHEFVHNAKRLFLENWNYDYKHDQKSDETLSDTLINGILKCHLFEINDDVKKLLALTKTPRDNESIKLPFPYIFIDTSFDKIEMEKLNINLGYEKIIGILLYSRELEIENRLPLLQRLFRAKKETETEEQIGAVFFNKNNGRIGFDAVSIMLEDEIVSKIKGKLDKNSFKFVGDFSIKLLNFLNTPDVEVILRKQKDERSVKRLKNGRLPLPPKAFIKITGETKEYLNDVKHAELWHYSHRFWIRGHFRKFKSDRYSIKKGMRIWIKPYIKGRGMLLEKKYKVIPKPENHRR